MLLNNKKYLFHMIQDYIEFRLQEIVNVSQLIYDKNVVCDYEYNKNSPIMICSLENDIIAMKISEKCFLLKSVSELFYQSNDFAGLLELMKNDKNFNIMNKHDTYKIVVITYNKSLSHEEKIHKIQEIVAALKLSEYRVCLDDDVKHIFYYFEEWQDIGSKDEKNKKLHKCYFTRFISFGQNLAVHKFNLKERCFIGNTSMDPQLSFIMANLGLVRDGSLVFDPFVGTGSLLISSAYSGAYVIGADLDFKLLHARGASSRSGQKFRLQHETIFNNLKQYGLENRYIDVLVADSSMDYLNENILFDAIITDPPYGIREKTKRIGQKEKKKKKEVDNNQIDVKQDMVNTNSLDLLEEYQENKPQHYPQRKKYMLSDIYQDLLNFSSTHLVNKGRVVFWLPVCLENREDMNDSEIQEVLIKHIPIRECFELVCFCEQRLTLTTSRLLVVMELYKLNEEKIRNNSESKNLLDTFRNKYFTSKIN